MLGWMMVWFYPPHEKFTRVIVEARRKKDIIYE
jgi:hypothetical protein